MILKIGRCALALPLLCVAAGAMCGEDGRAGDVTADERVVLLANGEVLRGRLRHEGDVCVVATETRELRIRKTAVVAAVADLDAAYAYQRDRLAQGDASGRLTLAGWAMRHGLYGHAARELADAAAMDPGHPELVRLRRRLDTAREQAARLAARAVEAHSADAQADDKAATAASADVDDAADAILAEIREEAVHTFATTVQPLLANRCATAGCHDLRSERGFRQLRPSARFGVSRRATMRNLRSVLEFVDRDEPNESDLLKYAAEAHGGLDEAVFAGRHEFLLRLLEDWIVDMAPAGGKTDVPATLVSNRTATSNSTPSEGEGAPTVDALLAGASGALDDDAVDESPRPAEPARPVGDGRGNVGSEPSLDDAKGRWRPTDPFDPEIFNRRFWPQLKQTVPDRWERSVHVGGGDEGG